MFHLVFVFLSVKARTAQLAKIKWFISVAFYILQVSVTWALHSCDFFFLCLLVYVYMYVGIFLCVLVYICVFLDCSTLHPLSQGRFIHGNVKLAACNLVRLLRAAVVSETRSLWVLGWQALYFLSHLSRPQL